MNFRQISKTPQLIVLLTFISLVSCKKSILSSTGSNESNAATLSDTSTSAENAYYDVLNTAFVGVSDNSSVWSTNLIHPGQTSTFSTEGNGLSHLGCAIYSIDDTIPGHYPKTMSLDFGAGCSSGDGIVRKGKITYLFTGSIFKPNSSITVTFSQYAVNGYGIQGAYQITNNSSIANGITFTTKVTNGIITYPDASNFHYNHNRTYTMTAGASTPSIISDDVYSISGNSSFSASDGSSLVSTITTPLVKAVSCHYVSAGVVSFVYDNAFNGTIDFGNGTCDNLATLKVGSISRIITLR